MCNKVRGQWKKQDGVLGQISLDPPTLETASYTLRGAVRCSCGLMSFHGLLVLGLPMLPAVCHVQLPCNGFPYLHARGLPWPGLALRQVLVPRSCPLESWWASPNCVGSIRSKHSSESCKGRWPISRSIHGTVGGLKHRVLSRWWWDHPGSLAVGRWLRKLIYPWTITL